MTPRNPTMYTRTSSKKKHENFMDMTPDMVKQNVQEALKKFQDTKNKEYKKIQKQINKLIGVLNKQKSETENSINRDK
jgi:hypothetical protein